MRRTLIIIGLVIVAAVAWSFRPRSIAVEFATVVRGPLEEILPEEGRTRVRERYAVLAPLDGTLQRIPLDPGTPVIAGETLIATIEPPAARLLDARTTEEARARVESAEAAVEEARARIDQVDAQRALAETEYIRQRDLVTSGDTPIGARDAAERTLRGLEGDLRRAGAALQVSEAERHGAEASLRRVDAPAATDEEGTPLTGPVTVRAPIDGVVLAVHREDAGPIAAGTTLVELGDLRDLEVVADYLTTDAVRIEPGMPARLEGWGGAAIAARVRRVEPRGVTKISALGVEEQRVDVILDPESPPATLGDGFRVEVRVIAWRNESVLRVPEGALFRSGEGGWALFRSEGGKAVETAVRIGHRDGRFAEILEGVREGEAVIVHPPDAVADNASVHARHGGSDR